MATYRAVPIVFTLAEFHALREFLRKNHHDIPASQLTRTALNKIDRAVPRTADQIRTTFKVATQSIQPKKPSVAPPPPPLP